MGGDSAHPYNFRIYKRIETKFCTVMELCIFYLKTEKVIFVCYANEFYYVILLFSSIKRYRNSNFCKIVIFKLSALKFATWIEKR